MRAVRRFGRCESGATAIEYGLICGLIFLAVVGGIKLMMGSSGGMYGKIGTAIGNALN